MKKIIALVMGIAFAFATAGFAVAQTTPAPTPAPATATKADKMAEQKAACLDKAGTDETKKASCEKKFAKKGTSMKKDAAPAQK